MTAEIVAAYQALDGNPGVRRMWAHLTVAGHCISPKRVHRLMKAADLQGRHSKQWKVTTIPGENTAPVPDLIGQVFTAPAPNMAWCGDIERHEAPADRAVMKGHRLRPVAASWAKLRAARSPGRG